jgi:hypothetical protein
MQENEVSKSIKSRTGSIRTRGTGTFAAVSALPMVISLVSPRDSAPQPVDMSNADVLDMIYGQAVRTPEGREPPDVSYVSQEWDTIFDILQARISRFLRSAYDGSSTGSPSRVAAETAWHLVTSEADVARGTCPNGMRDHSATMNNPFTRPSTQAAVLHFTFGEVVKYWEALQCCEPLVRSCANSGIKVPATTYEELQQVFTELSRLTDLATRDSEVFDVAELSQSEIDFKSCLNTLAIEYQNNLALKLHLLNETKDFGGTSSRTSSPLSLNDVFIVTSKHWSRMKMKYPLLHVATARALAARDPFWMDDSANSTMDNPSKTILFTIFPALLDVLKCGQSQVICKCRVWVADWK